uniref:Uncharacterized protein n=1 Tax=Streptomyces sp. NBC_00093 TaxID=2975649 RepID=A0AAU2AF56_9ACTN
MPSVTSWTRLEPHPSSPGMPGFAARVGDPLWLLARQWQLGELTGTDGGSPVRADLVADTAPLTRWAPRLPDGTPGAALDVALPLDAVVEAPGEATAIPDLDDRTAAVLGLDLLERLGAVAGPGTPLRAGLLSAHRLPTPDADASPEVRRRAELLRRRVPDGRTLLAAVRAAAAAGDASTALPGLDRGDPGAVSAARTAAAWLSSHDGVPGAGGPAHAAPPAWRTSALDYAFTVAAPTLGGGERVLAADGFGGGGIDWWALDARPDATLGAAGDGGATTTSLAVVPTRVGAPGLPTLRFWEFESGDVNLDVVSAAPEDLARLLLVEFAMVHGGDFYAVPLPVPVGSVTAVRTLTVLTTFGDTVDVPPAADVDAMRGRSPFRLFEPSLPDGSGAGWLVVLPTSVGALAGSPLEEVLLTRDETANAAWAVERVVPGADGRGTGRAEALHRAAGPPAEPDDDPEPAAPAQRYRLVTPVPATWVPLLPASSGGRPVLRVTGAPAGTLLATGDELHAECLSRAGALLRRVVRRARAADGRVVTWVARTSSPGRGESGSGLVFDSLESAP